jgi:DNA polymerase V
MIALADANNFYCSAERVFNPSLHNEPVIVLSNNDGCVISRSNEAKALGIKMAEPLYQIKYLCKKYKVNIFSSNYPLYGDMSQRIMKSLSYFSPEVDIYSIDEAFINLKGFEYKNLEVYAREIKETVKKWTGVPIALGIANNKTLAKLANHIAKRIKGDGVFQLNSLVQEKVLMQQLEVNEIWGIGKQTQIKLQRNNIDTVWDFYQADPLRIRQLLGITGLKTFNDLNGVVIEQLDLEIKDKQNIGSSRSFSQPALLLETLNSALSNYVMLAAQKLRKQGLYAQAIQVYLSTNRHRKDALQYQNSLTLPLISPSNHTGELISLAKTVLKLIYRSGYQYQKVGVLLLDLTKTLQTDLFTPMANDKKYSDNLMLTLDSINKKMGKNSLFFAAQGIKQHWKEKRNYQSPHYTTQWNNLPSVR